MALTHPIYLKSLVAIGEKDKKNQFTCKATGFLVGFIARNSKYPEKRTYWIFLVTNRHVFERRDQVFLRFNKKNGGVQIFNQPLFFEKSKEPRWLAHRDKKVDLALLYINPKILEEKDVDYFFFNQEMFAYYKDFKKIGIEIGDFVYILGFPLGISGKSQNYPCVKWGIISRLDKEIIRKTKSFWIDSSIFPGNSGGPVVLRPEIHSLGETKSVSRVFLLGVVSGYIPYEEKLYSFQYDIPQIVSLERENSGLSFIVPMDFVWQIFRKWREEKKKIEKALKQKQQIQKEIKKENETKT